MKFLHLSDLHIGIKLCGRDLNTDFEAAFLQVVEAAHKHAVDAVVIAGDIYDRSVPPAEGTALFDSFISKLNEALPEASIMIISGNHDSSLRMNMFRELLKDKNIYMIGTPPQLPANHIERVTLSDEFGPVNFYLLPFVKPSMVRKVLEAEDSEKNLTYEETIQRLLGREDIDEDERNVIVTHQFYWGNTESKERREESTEQSVEINESEEPTNILASSNERMKLGGSGLISASCLDMFDYCALGHIHKPMTLSRNACRYSGTLVYCSPKEIERDKNILLVEMGEKGDVSVKELPINLPRKVKQIEGPLEEILQSPSNDYMRIILTGEPEGDFAETLERIKAAFPNYLEIKRANKRIITYESDIEENDITGSPLKLCEAFLGGLSKEERKILEEIL